MICERCKGEFPRSSLRPVQEGELCDLCLKEYANEHQDEYLDGYIADNRKGFLLDYFKAGDCIWPFSEDWWEELLTRVLNECAILYPHEVQKLRQGYIAHSDGYEDYVVKQEKERHRQGRGAA